MLNTLLLWYFISNVHILAFIEGSQIQDTHFKMSQDTSVCFLTQANIS